MILIHFRKDNIIFTICIFITLIGSLLIIIKKLISRRIIQRIPKSNIVPQSTNGREQSLQMETFHSTPRNIQVQPRNKNDPLYPGKHGNILIRSVSEANVNLGLAVLFNNHKYNKNIINLSGLFIIGMIFGIGFGLCFSSRFGWIMHHQAILFTFVHFCCVPVLLPTIYFMKKPNHLIFVLREHNSFWFDLIY